MKKLSYKTALEALYSGGTLLNGFFTGSYRILNKHDELLGFVTFGNAMKLYDNNNLLKVSKPHEMNDKYKISVFALD